MSETDNKLTDGFAERLCDLMQENKTCADALAQELNLSSSAIYKWLRKASLPEFENAIALADFFDCSLDYLSHWMKSTHNIRRIIPHCRFASSFQTSSPKRKCPNIALSSSPAYPEAK